MAAAQNRRLRDLLERERDAFARTHPSSLALAGQLGAHWLQGAPNHWMQDWAAALAAARGAGAVLTCADGLAYDDFCLGDTPGMFGHARAEIADAVARQMREGATFMLPNAQAERVGAKLAARFGLPLWQAALSASDCNRAALRWARAITGRTRVLIFDGCYHGMVEDCFAVLDADGRVTPDPGLVGQVHDVTQTTRVVPFNDVEALRAALAAGDVAAVLAEPAMTNCGIIAPDPGFHDALRALTRAHGTLLILDETHTLSTSPSGYCGAHGLAPDMLVIGKAIAGGFPAAVWGVTAELGARIRAHKRGAGRSGIGTTLAGSALAMAAIEASLDHLIQPENYAAMLAGAARLVEGLQRVIAARGAPWCVVHVGARAEIVFAPHPPRDAAAMRAALAQEALNEALHLYLINRGILLAPFHTMMLVSPATTAEQIDRLVEAVDAFLGEGVVQE